MQSVLVPLSPKSQHPPVQTCPTEQDFLVDAVSQFIIECSPVPTSNTRDDPL